MARLLPASAVAVAVAAAASTDVDSAADADLSVDVRHGRNSFGSARHDIPDDATIFSEDGAPRCTVCRHHDAEFERFCPLCKRAGESRPWSYACRICKEAALDSSSEPSPCPQCLGRGSVQTARAKPEHFRFAHGIPRLGVAPVGDGNEDMDRWADGIMMDYHDLLQRASRCILDGDIPGAVEIFRAANPVLEVCTKSAMNDDLGRALCAQDTIRVLGEAVDAETAPAISVLLHCARIWQVSNGAGELEKLRTLRTHGNCLMRLGMRTDALPLLQEALDRLKRIHGAGDLADLDLELADALTSVASAQTDSSKKRDLLFQVKAIRDSKLGPTHLSTCKTTTSLGHALLQSGQVSAARDMLEETVRNIEAARGRSDRMVIMPLANLASAYGKLGDHAHKQLLLERVLEIQERTMGVRHRDTALTLTQLGQAQKTLGGVQKARIALERALDIIEHEYGPAHGKASMTLVNLAEVHILLGEPTRGLELLERALSIQERDLGKNHEQVVKSLASLSSVHLALKQPDEAAMRLERALDVQRLSSAQHGGYVFRALAKTLVYLATAPGKLYPTVYNRNVLQPDFVTVSALRSAGGR